MHHLKYIQELPISIDRAWDFFSSPKNLKIITPPALNLLPTVELPDKMYPGMFIEYTVRPILGIPSKWVTEITHVVEKFYFVDEQRVGPYSIWHHQHHFKEINGGVQMIDIIDYKVPFGVIGLLMEKAFIRNKIKDIFDYREKKLVELFGIYDNKKRTAHGRSQ